MKLVRLVKVKSILCKVSICVSLAFSLNTSVFAQKAELESIEGRSGYAIGVNIGMNLSSQGVAEDLNTDSLVAGLVDALNDDLKLSEDEIIAAIQEFSLLQQSKAQAAVEAQSQVGKDFLLNNAKSPGVVTTASGLQYEVMTVADDSAAAKPKAEDTVNVHYHGTLIDGSVFDSSVDRGEPISFPLNGVISGWTEGLQLMRVGEKYRFFIPPELAYGENGAGAIGPNSTLIFEVELLGIE